PPIESILGLDAALKAARVRLCKWFAPPTETNYGGGYLAGALPEVEAAARAFAAAVVETARHPQAAARPVRAAGETLEARPPGPGPGAGRFRVLQTGQRLALKPAPLTPPSGGEAPGPQDQPPHRAARTARAAGGGAPRRAGRGIGRGRTRPGGRAGRGARAGAGPGGRRGDRPARAVPESARSGCGRDPPRVAPYLGALP